MPRSSRSGSPQSLLLLPAIICMLALVLLGGTPDAQFSTLVGS